MNTDNKRAYFTFSSAYFFFFFGLGAFYPLFSVYLEALGLNGKQIGILTALGPIVAILTQPTWGLISDRYQVPRKILMIGLAVLAVITLFFPWFTSFWALFILLLLLNIFQAPVIPVLDNLSINYAHRVGIEYGNMRLWGAVGFAIAVYISGLVSEWTNQTAIFYLFFGATVFAALSVLTVPSESERVNVPILSSLRKLIGIPHFILLLLSSFLVFGPMSANNYYFGIYYQHIGGTLAGIGLVFLLATGSEAPFMRIGGKVIEKIGLENTLLFAAVISFGRWIIFSFNPGPGIILSLFFLQGLSVGIFLTAAPQIVKRYTPQEVQVTAMAVYSAFGNGLGTMFSNLIGGWIYDSYSIIATYVFFTVLTMLGIIASLFIKILKVTH